MCAGRKNPHLYTPSLHHQARLPRVRALDKEARDWHTVTWPPAPANLSPYCRARRAQTSLEPLLSGLGEDGSLRQKGAQSVLPP